MSIRRDFSLGAKHEAVIKNDGSRMVSHWKIYMIKFYEKNNFKHLIIGYRMLSKLADATSEQLL